MSEKSTAADLVELARRSIEAQSMDEALSFYAPDAVRDTEGLVVRNTTYTDVEEARTAGERLAGSKG